MAARTITLATIRAEVRYEADIENELDRHPDARIDKMINRSWQRLRQMVSEAGSDFYLKTATGTTPAATDSGYVSFASIDLPLDTIGVYGFDLVFSNGPKSLRRMAFGERNDLRYCDTDEPFVLGSNRVPAGWFLLDAAQETTTAASAGKLAIAPAPGLAYPYALHYLPSWVDITDDTYVFNGHAGWEDWVIWDCVVRIAARDNDAHGTHAIAVAERDAIAKKIRAEVVRYNRGGPRRRQDSREREAQVPFVAAAPGVVVPPTTVGADGTISLRYYGASPSATSAVNTAAIQAVINLAKAQGLTVVDTIGGTYKVTALALGAGAAPWALRGAGMGRTIFKRDGNNPDNVLNCASSSVPFELSDFSIDGSHDTASNGTHALALGNVSGVRVRRVRAFNYKNTGILVYADTPHTNSDIVIDDCEANGGGPAEAGIIVADVDRSGVINSRAFNCTGGVGFGIELKDTCSYCFVSDCYVEGCTDGFGHGWTTGTGVQWSTWTNLRANNCTIPWISSHSAFNTVVGFTINQNANVGHCIRLETGDTNNTFSGIVAQNIAATRGVVYCKSTASNNYFRIDSVDTLNNGKVCEFDSTATGNVVELIRMTNPTLRSGGVEAEANFSADGTPSTGNGYRHQGYATLESITLASNVATVRNMLAEALSILGEASAADQLDDIAGVNKTEGRVLHLRASSAGTSPITVPDGTNFDMAGGVSFVLDGQPDVLAIRYTGASVSKWCEVARANNG